MIKLKTKQTKTAKFEAFKKYCNKIIDLDNPKHQINMPSLKQVLKKMKPCVTCNFWNTKVNENQR